MDKKAIKIVVSLILLVISMIIEMTTFKVEEILKIILLLVSYLLVGFDVLKEAIENILHGKVFDENFLMSIATIGAIIIGEYPEAVAVMLFYQIGEYLQEKAVQNSKKSITELMKIRPDYANLKVGNKVIKKSPNEVKIGDIIEVKPGEKIPLDGIILSGESLIDTSALTGESIPRTVKKDDTILSGCVNQNGVLEIKVTKEYGESTVNKILNLVENASSKKAKTENFITKFSKYYTPIVVILALIIAIIVPIITRQEFSTWIYRALTFLVVSCPCALVISIPLSFFSGIGANSKNGILVKGSNYLEMLTKVDTIVFDKTGTLTKGVFKVQNISCEKGFSKEEILRYAAYCESSSNHPISLSIQKEYGKNIERQKIRSINEISGKGIISIIEDENKEIKIACGNIKLMHDLGINIKIIEKIGTIVYVAINDKYAGKLVIKDEIKEDSKKAIEKLKNIGVHKIVMLTGDKKEIAQEVAKELKIDEVYSELLPTDKVEKIEELIKYKLNEKTALGFVGDGINDAPVLARADIGIAMGGLGSDAAIEAADIVIMNDEPLKIKTAISISRKTLKIAYQNIIFAILVKVLILLFSTLGIATMWMAVFADVGVTIIAILNALRILKNREN